jgi:PleD family two-component response regulator
MEYSVDILLVEDTSTQSILMQHMLNSAGYSVHACISAEDALKYIKSARPAMILSDINLPEMDGFQLSRFIKDNAELRSTPVVLLIAFKDREDVFRALESGADDLMLKLLHRDYFIPSFSSIWHRVSSPGPNNAIIKTSVQYGSTSRRIEGSSIQILNMLFSCFDTVVHQQSLQSRSHSSH